MLIHNVKILASDSKRISQIMAQATKKVDLLSDEALALEELRLSKKIGRLLGSQSKTRPVGFRAKKWFVRTAKTASTVLIAAASILLFNTFGDRHDLSHGTQSKGHSPIGSIYCDIATIQSPDFEKNYLKVRCIEPVFLHIGLKVGDDVKLLIRNIRVSAQDRFVKQNEEYLDLFTLAPQGSSLVAVATRDELQQEILSSAESEDLWIVEID